MATNFPAQPAYTTPPNSQGNQQFSHAKTTADTPIDLSPSSPRSSFMFPNFPHATRQLRPLKSPMYVPAVLRPTERPHRPSPPTPPRSANNSTDSLDRSSGLRQPSRRSTRESASFEAPVTTDDDISLGPIEGLPTRAHWKPDSHALICDAPTCQKTFSLFERRHHCRHCGHVFCAAHSQYTIPLDHRAEFHPEGSCSRACKHCWDRYCAWNSRRLSSSGEAGNEGEIAGVSEGRNIEGRGREREGPKGGLAGSMPRDWNWSTF